MTSDEIKSKSTTLGEGATGAYWLKELAYQLAKLIEIIECQIKEADNG